MEGELLPNHHPSNISQRVAGTSQKCFICFARQGIHQIYDYKDQDCKSSESRMLSGNVSLDQRMPWHCDPSLSCCHCIFVSQSIFVLMLDYAHYAIVYKSWSFCSFCACWDINKRVCPRFWTWYQDLLTVLVFCIRWVNDLQGNLQDRSDGASLPDCSEAAMILLQAVYSMP